MKAPSSIRQLLTTSFRQLFPVVNQELNHWRKEARQIPNDELRTQALASMNTKTFHCEGGSIYATLARERWGEAIKFIVAYQTISDYLDNLCDRSQSLDPDDFRQLHEAQLDAIRLGADSYKKNYYAYRDDQDDHHYLQKLVDQCQNVIRSIPNYIDIQPHIERLASLYVDLQVHKHVTEEERIPRLTAWYDHYNQDPNLRWYEFSAATGSTLGVFCLVAYGLNGDNKGRMVEDAFFPSLQGLHILLDYLIDQEEDAAEGDLNFIDYYHDEDEKVSRMKHMIKRARRDLQGVDDARFHQLIVDGLVGLYLSDDKMRQTTEQMKVAKELLREAGWRSRIVYVGGRVYRRYKYKMKFK
ncbi:tetraprenyl-beta-curcumene synthase [Alkalibacillus flavidus]|uniref:Tetraprenyl-beta-curcumene synthase n=1 Tax=Alkalibacillus flavidus TaxID=546021 RepID=A0ABV2KVK7_9BACI